MMSVDKRDSRKFQRAKEFLKKFCKGKRFLVIYGKAILDKAKEREHIQVSICVGYHGHRYAVVRDGAGWVNPAPSRIWSLSFG